MSEMRWDPIRQEWLITATHRMERTFFPPKEYCPLCPTKKGAYATEIPLEDFEIAVFENRFPSFQTPPPETGIKATPFNPIKPAQGVCEVVVYTSDHNQSMSGLSKEQITSLVRVWRDRYEDLGKKKEISYILIFENRGEEVGVTLHHPHGQIYAFPYIPPVPAREIASAHEYKKDTERCLFCDILEYEESDGARILTSNAAFTAFVPFAARYSYEVHVYSRKHRPSLSHLTGEEEELLAEILQKVVRCYDNLFDQDFPYIMVIHQAPVKDDSGLCHLHFEFYPPLRNKGKLKYLAGCEQGAGTFINDSVPEKKVLQLRDKLPKD